MMNHQIRKSTINSVSYAVWIFFTVFNNWNKKCLVEMVTVPIKFTYLRNTFHGRLATPGELSEDLVTKEKRNKGWRMNCDVGKATEGLENELWRR